MNRFRGIRYRRYNPTLACTASIFNISWELLKITVTLVSLPLIFVGAILSGMIIGPVATQRRYSPSRRRKW
jgi:hypothetical protein